MTTCVPIQISSHPRSALRTRARYRVDHVAESPAGYRIERARFQGEFGFERPVVLKGLPRADPRARRLAAEARLFAQLRSPSLVGVIDLIEREGWLCVCQEVAYGLDVVQLAARARRRGKTVPPAVFERVLADALLALDVLTHARGRAGRYWQSRGVSLGPNDLIVCRDGRTRLLPIGRFRARDEFDQRDAARADGLRDLGRALLALACAPAAASFNRIPRMPTRRRRLMRLLMGAPMTADAILGGLRVDPVSSSSVAVAELVRALSSPRLDAAIRRSWVPIRRPRNRVRTSPTSPTCTEDADPTRPMPLRPRRRTG